MCSQVSFLDAPTSWDEVDGLFVVNRVVDLIFIFDLGLQFFLMYPAGDNIGGVHWVDSRRQIVRHYLMGWFGLDFFAIMLVTIDFITIESGGGDASDVKDLRVLRVLRALRLVKLVRDFVHSAQKSLEALLDKVMDCSLNETALEGA